MSAGLVGLGELAALEGALISGKIVQVVWVLGLLFARDGFQLSLDVLDSTHFLELFLVLFFDLVDVLADM